MRKSPSFLPAKASCEYAVWYPTTNTIKILKIWPPQKNCCNHPKIRTMHPKHADAMANGVDPDQTAPLVFRSSLNLVCTVCPDLSVQNLRIIMVVNAIKDAKDTGGIANRVDPDPTAPELGLHCLPRPTILSFFSGLIKWCLPYLFFRRNIPIKVYMYLIRPFLFCLH